MVFVGCDSQTPIRGEAESRVEAKAPNSPRAKTRSEHTFIVEQDDRCFSIEPLSTDRSVRAFYGYNGAHSNTPPGLERSDVSTLFLYEGSTGETSLVVIHDRPGDGSDGQGSFDFTGLPTGSGQWVVEDDPSDFSPTDTLPDWTWLARFNDGGAWRGGLNGSFTITIDPDFVQGITDWDVLSGDVSSPDRLNLNLDAPVTIRTGTCPIEVNLDIKPGSDPNAVNPDGRGLIPVAILHTDDFNPVDRADVSTLRFGDPENVDGDGAEAAHSGHAEDIDQDGDKDLILHFPTSEADFEGDEDEGKLIGKTNGGTSLFGTDTVKLVGGENGGPPPSAGPSGNGGSPGNRNAQ